jgi:hypothetical protein
MSASVGFIKKKFVKMQHGHMNVKKRLIDICETWKTNKQGVTRTTQIEHSALY